MGAKWAGEYTKVLHIYVVFMAEHGVVLKTGSRQHEKEQNLYCMLTLKDTMPPPAPCQCMAVTVMARWHDVES